MRAGGSRGAAGSLSRVSWRAAVGRTRCERRRFDLKIFFTVVDKPVEAVRPSGRDGVHPFARGMDRPRRVAARVVGLSDQDGAAPVVERVRVVRVLACGRGMCAATRCRAGWRRAGNVPSIARGVPLVRTPRTLPRILSPVEVDG